MALLNYKRMLTAERFCLCQRSQQPQLNRQHLGGEKASFLGWTKCTNVWSAPYRVKWRLNEPACQLSANSAVLLLNTAAELQFKPNSTFAPTPHCSAEAHISTARETEQQVQLPMRSGVFLSSRTSSFYANKDPFWQDLKLRQQ